MIVAMVMIWELTKAVIAVETRSCNALQSHIFLKQVSITVTLICYIALYLCQEASGFNSHRIE